MCLPRQLCFGVIVLHNVSSSYLIFIKGFPPGPGGRSHDMEALQTTPGTGRASSFRIGRPCCDALAAEMRSKLKSTIQGWGLTAASAYRTDIFVHVNLVLHNLLESGRREKIILTIRNIWVATLQTCHSTPHESDEKTLLCDKSVILYFRQPPEADG